MIVTSGALAATTVALCGLQEMFLRLSLRGAVQIHSFIASPSEINQFQHSGRCVGALITTAFNKALLLAAAADHRSITDVTVGNINFIDRSRRSHWDAGKCKTENKGSKVSQFALYLIIL